MVRPSRTAVCLSAILLMNLWNSCTVRRIENRVEELVQQVDSVEHKANNASEELDGIKTALDEVKSTVEDSCGG